MGIDFDGCGSVGFGGRFRFVEKHFQERSVEPQIPRDDKGEGGVSIGG